ncbi:MAG TPA: phosphate uptake regulator PhoU [Candidatus Altiarchaeales archaeon]|nr:phosphate uptake regulator PhoU [Candidatus Altiarchaeales archaeon]
MEYRKIQLTGESTYILSLPKRWVKKNKLDKGDVLSIMERGDTLLLKPREEREIEAEIDLEKKSLELISRSLITKYIQGFDTVVIRSKRYIPPEIRKGLKEISSLLIGMEQFGETSNELVFRMLMREKGDVADTVLRMHRMSLSSLEELLRNITPENYNEHILKDIIQRDDEIDKFYFLIFRQLSSAGGYECSMWIQIAKSIERISDHIENIANLVIQGGKVREEDIDIYKELIDMYSSLKFALMNKSSKRAGEIIDKVKSFRVEEKRIMRSIKAKEPETLLIYESFRRIGEYISDIAEVVINMT